MTISREGRRSARVPRAVTDFGEGADAALDIIDLLELAWHDCHGEVTPPAEVMADVWLLADGDVGSLASAARLAVTDFRDLRLAADVVRRRA